MQTRAVAQSFRSELSLWRRGVIEAPYKMRPWVNYGVALVAAGRMDEARVAFQMAERASDLPQTPWWDRDMGHTIVAANLRSLDQVASWTSGSAAPSSH